jgi:phage tail tape-measure protein
MAKATKITVVEGKPVEAHAHDGGGALGMTAGGVAGGFIAGAAAAAAAGASTGAIAGSVAGPIGAIAGAAIGGAIGGVVGEDLARRINPTDEEKYWETAYTNRPYYSATYNYEAYRPAYRLRCRQLHEQPRQRF